MNGDDVEVLFTSAPHMQVSSSSLSNIRCLQEWDTSEAPLALKAGGEVEHWSALFPHQGSSFSTWLGFHHAARGADNQATGSGGKTARRDVAREEKRQLMSPNRASCETGRRGHPSFIPACCWGCEKCSSMQQQGWGQWFSNRGLQPLQRAGLYDRRDANNVSTIKLRLSRWWFYCWPPYKHRQGGPFIFLFWIQMLMLC